MKDGKDKCKNKELKIKIIICAIDKEAFSRQISVLTSKLRLDSVINWSILYLEHYNA